MATMEITDPDHDPLLGQLVGSYRVEKLVGKGGMGAVYLASHQTIRRRVALKVLLPEYTSRADISARFVQEAMSASHVVGLDGKTHRNVVEPIDTGTLPDGRMFIMVEFLEGVDLDRYLADRGGRLAEDEILWFLFQTCAALDAAHNTQDPRSGRPAPIVHRDIKPPNLFITRDDLGRPLLKLLDFGIAKVASAMRETGIQTGAGHVMGSPAYMAPEQIRSPLSVDSRADIYALGVVIYQLVTGRLPHVADNAMGYVLAKQEQAVTPISVLVPDASRVWDVVVARCLTWDPDNRYRSVRMIVADLVEGANGLPGVPDAARILEAAWPTYAMHAAPTDETARAYSASTSATPPPGWTVAHGSAPGTLASAVGVRSSTVARRSRLGLVLGALGALAVVGGAIAFALVGSGRRSGSLAAPVGDDASTAQTAGAIQPPDAASELSADEIPPVTAADGADAGLPLATTSPPDAATQERAKRPQRASGSSTRRTQRSSEARTERSTDDIGRLSP